MSVLRLRLCLVALMSIGSGAALAQYGAPAPIASPAAPGISQGSAGPNGFRYPEPTAVPSSTLRMREIATPGVAGPAPVAVTDSPASVEQYRLCQRNADRAATDIADMQGRIAACLAQLNERRNAGQ